MFASPKKALKRVSHHSIESKQFIDFTSSSILLFKNDGREGSIVNLLSISNYVNNPDFLLLSLRPFVFPPTKSLENLYSIPNILLKYL